ncbi:hypothetical protein BT96DRAFT_816963, partial [Gymnopus androsaceus JB14]
QTLVPVILDTASPPGGSLDLFNIYVALSRGLGQKAIQFWLLQMFDEKLFLQGHLSELLEEGDRLDENKMLVEGDANQGSVEADI